MHPGEEVIYIYICIHVCVCVCVCVRARAIGCVEGEDQRVRETETKLTTLSKLTVRRSCESEGGGSEAEEHERAGALRDQAYRNEHDGQQALDHHFLSLPGLFAKEADEQKKNLLH